MSISVDNFHPSGHFKQRFWNKASTIGGGIDAILVVVGLGGAKGLFGKALAKFIKKNKKKIINKFNTIVEEVVKNKKARRLLTGWGSVTVQAMLAFAGYSFGTAIAKGIDYIDPKIKSKYKRNNGYILN